VRAVAASGASPQPGAPSTKRGPSRIGLSVGTGERRLGAKIYTALGVREEGSGRLPDIAVRCTSVGAERDGLFGAESKELDTDRLIDERPQRLDFDPWRCFLSSCLATHLTPPVRSALKLSFLPSGRG